MRQLFLLASAILLAITSCTKEDEDLHLKS